MMGGYNTVRVGTVVRFCSPCEQLHSLLRLRKIDNVNKCIVKKENTMFLPMLTHF